MQKEMDRASFGTKQRVKIVLEPTLLDEKSFETQAKDFCFEKHISLI